MKRQFLRIGKIRQIWFKCRQPGGSTLASGIVFWKTGLFSDVYSFVIAQDKTTAGRIFKMHSFFYDNMDPALRPMRRYFQEGTKIAFENPDDRTRSDNPGLSSQILVAEAKNINVGTGQTIHVLHSTELARYAYVDHIKDSLIPALSDAAGTIRIWESTAFGAPGGAYFRYLCEKAMRDQNENPEYHFVPWWHLPKYKIPLLPKEKLKLTVDERYLIKTHKMSLDNIKWRRFKIDELLGDEDSFSQSYPCTFEEGWITKDISAFPRDRLLELQSMIKIPIRRCEIVAGVLYDDPQGRLWIWENPIPGKQYDIGADVAVGVEGGDYSAAQVVERYTLKQVAEFQGHMELYDYAEFLATLGRYYNTAQIAPEFEGPGYAVVTLLNSMYYNVYIWRHRDQVVPKRTKQTGWSTTHRSKMDLVAFARHNIWHRKIQIFSDRLWRELITYVRGVTPTGLDTFNASAGYHDDLCQAWMIALKSSDDENFLKLVKPADLALARVEDQIIEDRGVCTDSNPIIFNREESQNEYEPWRL